MWSALSAEVTGRRGQAGPPAAVVRALVVMSVAAVGLAACTRPQISQGQRCSADVDCEGLACQAAADSSGSVCGPPPNETGPADDDGATSGAATSASPSPSSSGVTDTASDSDATCAATDECMSDADCGGRDSCDPSSCICIGAADSGDGGSVSSGGTGVCMTPDCAGTCPRCPDCLACVQGPTGDCLDENETCNLSPACNSIVVCYNACSDAACEDQCVADSPDGAEDFNLLMDCVLAPANCMAACPALGP